MNNHPINLALRFLLELVALGIFATWGWRHEGVLKFVLAIGIPLLAMAIWGVFRVPGDPGNAPVAVSGIVRLLIESLFFGTALLFLFQMELNRYGWLLLFILLLHYAVSYDRIGRLLHL